MKNRFSILLGVNVIFLKAKVMIRKTSLIVKYLTINKINVKSILIFLQSKREKQNIEPSLF